MLSAALNIRSKLFGVVYKALYNLVPAHFSPSQLYWTNLVFCFFHLPGLWHAVGATLQQCHPTSPFLSSLTPNNSWRRHHFSQEAYPGTSPTPGTSSLSSLQFLSHSTNDSTLHHLSAHLHLPWNSRSKMVELLSVMLKVVPQNLKGW